MDSADQTNTWYYLKFENYITFKESNKIYLNDRGNVIII